MIAQAGSLLSDMIELCQRRKNGFGIVDDHLLIYCFEWDQLFTAQIAQRPSINVQHFEKLFLTNEVPPRALADCCLFPHDSGRMCRFPTS